MTATACRNRSSCPIPAGQSRRGEPNRHRLQRLGRLRRQPGRLERAQPLHLGRTGRHARRVVADREPHTTRSRCTTALTRERSTRPGDRAARCWEPSVCGGLPPTVASMCSTPTSNWSPCPAPVAIEPALSGCSPFGIQAIGDLIYVAYAKQDVNGEDEAAGPGLGLLDALRRRGQGLIEPTRRSGGPLNAPWGIALAPAGFGPFSGALLVGNFGDGLIFAFEPHSGAMRGPASAWTDGDPIRIDGLWGIAFGNGSNNQPTDTLFFAAGPGATNSTACTVASTRHRVACTASSLPPRRIEREDRGGGGDRSQNQPVFPCGLRCEGWPQMPSKLHFTGVTHNHPMESSRLALPRAGLQAGAVGNKRGCSSLERDVVVHVVEAGARDFAAGFAAGARGARARCAASPCVVARRRRRPCLRGCRASASDRR